MNTVKVQGNIYVDQGTVLYSDLGKALFTVVEDTCGKHDTIYGCCSEPNNFLRYGVRGTHSCFANFTEALAQFGLDRTYIVSNVNFFMAVPIDGAGSALNVFGHSKPGNHVDLRAERDVLAVLSNCPQMHNPCNAYKLTPIRATIWRPLKRRRRKTAIVSAPIYHLIPNAPKPVAPYSHVVEADGWLFVTGQLATDPDDDHAAASRRDRGADPQGDGQSGARARRRRCRVRACRPSAHLSDGFRARLRRVQQALHRIFWARPAAGADHRGVTQLARGGIVEVDLIARRY